MLRERQDGDAGRPRFAEPEKTHDAPAGHERLFWRKLAYWGATRGPEWWVRYSPPVFGWAAAIFVPRAREAVRMNLRAIRGPVSPLREAREVFTTFGTYASCLAEVLSNDAATGPKRPHAVILGERFVRQAIRQRKGILLATAHTAGWESVGPLLSHTLRQGVDVAERSGAAEAHGGFGGRKPPKGVEGASRRGELMFVMHREPDERAGELQDHARLRTGVRITHVGDPLASLPLLHHLRSGGLVGLQLDRIVPGMRTMPVELLGVPGQIPEGPIRLAQLSGAPILPIFCARRGHRSYVVEAFEPINVDRRASPETIASSAQHLATSMTTFLREHPTQWFQFGGR